MPLNYPPLGYTGEVETLSPNPSTKEGIVRAATSAEALAGTRGDIYISPLTLGGAGSELGPKTLHGVILGEGPGAALGATAAGAVGTVLAGNGSSADPTFQAISALNIVDSTGTTQAMAANTTYIADNAATVVFTLPATAVQGSEITVSGNGTGGWQIAQNASQVIKGAGATTTTGTGGSLNSTSRYDSVTLVATVGGASTVWVINDFSGSFTFV